MACDEQIESPRPEEQPIDSGKKQRTPISSEDIFSRGATDEQLEALRAAAAAHKAAQADLMEVAGVLWNSKVDAAMSMVGGAQGASVAMTQLRIALSQRLGFFDNCTCAPCRITLCW
jgi:hypothetical protein